MRAGETTEDERLLPFDLRGLARTVSLRADGTPWRRREVRIDPLEPRSAFRDRTDGD